MKRCVDCIHCGACESSCGGLYFSPAVVPCAECGGDLDRERDDCVRVDGKYYHAECAPQEGE